MFGTEAENAVIVALDHGMHGGPRERFNNPEATLARVLEGEPDGVLVGVPFLERFRKVLEDYVTIATLDVLHSSTVPGVSESAEIHKQAFTAGDADRAGADGIKVALVYGREDPETLATNLQFTAETAMDARNRGMEAVIEPTLWGNRIENRLDATQLHHVNRIGFEMGATILKSPYPGDTEAFEPIVHDAPVPVMIAGGPATETDREALAYVRGAMDAGGNGVIMGRNVWQRENVTEMIQAINAIVHEGATVDQALEILA